ncbi:MAG TPA: DNA gyrase inhibitor YacG [Alphaproteobacteria bacterium]|nr:DNA gyrase inhibitor YacG [Alphaproteobacteria bacterium]
MAKIAKFAPKRRAAKGCPICGKPSAAAYRPFCSKRCADIDLHRWLGGVYRVETDETPEEAGLEGGKAKAESEEDQ